MTDPNLDFMGIIRDDLDACPDRSFVLDLSSLQGGWRGEAEIGFCLWFVMTFLPPNEARRITRAVESVPRFFRNLARLEGQTTGEPSQLDHHLIRQLQHALLQAMYPQVSEIAFGAKKHPAVVCSRNLKRVIPEASWRTRS